MKKLFLIFILVTIFLWGCSPKVTTTKTPIKSRYEIQMMAHQHEEQQSQQQLIDTTDVQSTPATDEYSQSPTVTVNYIDLGYSGGYPYYNYNYWYPYYYYPYYSWGWEWGYYPYYYYPFYNHHHHNGYYYGQRHGWYNHDGNNWNNGHRNGITPAPKPNNRHNNSYQYQRNGRTNDVNGYHQRNPRSVQQTQPRYIKPAEKRQSQNYSSPTYRQPKSSQEYISPRNSRIAPSPVQRHNYSTPNNNQRNYNNQRSNPRYSAPRNTPSYTPRSNPSYTPRSSPPSGSGGSRNSGGRRR